MKTSSLVSVSFVLLQAIFCHNAYSQCVLDFGEVQVGEVRYLSGVVSLPAAPINGSFYEEYVETPDSIHFTHSFGSKGYEGTQGIFSADFRPRTPGLKSHQFNFVAFDWIDSLWGPFKVPCEYRGVGIRPPLRCVPQENGSIIRVTNRSVGESVPIVGTDFTLNYSSEFAPTYVSGGTGTFSGKFGFAREGWSISAHRLYDHGQTRLYLGTGSKEYRKYTELSDLTRMVVASDGEEAYIFSLSGKHLRTIKTLTGAIKYTFGYDSSDRLTSIKDAFGNTTTLIRNSGGRLIAINAPRGQKTTLTLTSAGLISRITNPNNESFQISYKTNTGLMATFMRPGGQISRFSYDSFGKLTQDLGNGGNLWDLIADTGTKIVKASKMNRRTIYDVNDDTGLIVETNSSGLVTSTQESADGGITQSTLVDSSTSSTVQDGRFGGLQLANLHAHQQWRS